jgi:ABC-type spermidine/putrescine transport system permease subunit I
VLTIAIGYPLAYVIAFRGGRYRTVLLGLVVVPFFTSYLIRTIAWRSLLSDNGEIVQLLDAIRLSGLLDSIGIMENGRILQTPVAVIGGLTYNFLPFMILPIYVSLEKVDPRSSTPPKTCTRPRPPRSARSSSRCRCPACSPARCSRSSRRPATSSTLYLGSPSTTMIGNSIQDQFLVQNNVPLASAMSFVLMAIITVMVLIYSQVLRHRGPGVSGPTSMRGSIAKWALNVYALLALLYLFIPIAWIVGFSFNKPRGNYNVQWQEFTLDNWRDPFGDEALTDAFVESLKIAAISTSVAVVLGSLIAIALARYRFRGSGTLNFLLVLPLTTPEIVLGSSLATLFLDWDVTRGFTTVVIAHIMFQVSFVALTVRARVRGFDWTLEQAAQDLGATPGADVLEGDVPAHPPRHPRRRAAVVRALDRRLHHHAVQRRVAEHVPALHQRQLPGPVPTAGQRAGERGAVRERGADGRRCAAGQPSLEDELSNPRERREPGTQGHRALRFIGRRLAGSRSRRCVSMSTPAGSSTWSRVRPAGS